MKKRKHFSSLLVVLFFISSFTTIYLANTTQYEAIEKQVKATKKDEIKSLTTNHRVKEGDYISKTVYEKKPFAEIALFASFVFCTIYLFGVVKDLKKQKNLNM